MKNAKYSLLICWLLFSIAMHFATMLDSQNYNFVPLNVKQYSIITDSPSILSICRFSQGSSEFQWIGLLVEKF